MDCGEADIVVLDFDHLRDKVATISRLLQRHELARILEEIEKCEVVCANCHRRRTAKRAGWYRLRANDNERREGLSDGARPEPTGDP